MSLEFMRSLVCPIPPPDYPIAKFLKGAFVVGLIVPRQGNLAITLTEKLEDAVSIIFLPLVWVQGHRILTLSSPT